MLVAESRVKTDRAGRYLVQLFRHLSAKARTNPELHAHVECSDDRGEVGFEWGRCTVRVDRDALAMRAEARDEEALRRIEHVIKVNLERFGRGDLNVNWMTTAGERTGACTPDERDGGHAHDR
jgi:hypothetical protein